MSSVTLPSLPSRSASSLRSVLGLAFLLTASVASAQFLTAHAQGYESSINGGNSNYVESNGGGNNAPDALAQISGEFAVDPGDQLQHQGSGTAYAYATKFGKVELQSTGSANNIVNPKYFSTGCNVSFRDSLTITNGTGTGYLRVAIQASGGQFYSHWGSYGLITGVQANSSTIGGLVLNRSWSKEGNDPTTGPFFSDSPFSFNERVVTDAIPFTYGVPFFVDMNCYASTTMPISNTIRSGETNLEANFLIDNLTVYESDGTTLSANPIVASAYGNNYSVNPVPEPSQFFALALGVYALRRNRAFNRVEPSPARNPLLGGWPG